MFDRRTIGALRQLGHEVDVVHPLPATRWQELGNRLAGLPHYRTRYATAGNRRRVTAAGAGHDLAVCSWEPLDALARRLPPPVVLIAHNVTSLALPQLYPGSRLASLLARRAAEWERHLYRSPNLSAIATLSLRDHDHVAAQPGVRPVLLTVPGMPPLVPLAADARLRAEIVIAGTYDWRPKRRDVIRFAREYARSGGCLPVRADRLPDEARAALPTLAPWSAEAAGEAIRLGLITDRFEAGHKLKTLAYIAQNQIVLSFSDAAHDLQEVPDHEFFIRRLAEAADIPAHAAQVAAVDPAELRDRLLRFQRRCAARFTWAAVANRLVEAARPL